MYSPDIRWCQGFGEFQLPFLHVQGFDAAELQGIEIRKVFIDRRKSVFVSSFFDLAFVPRQENVLNKFLKSDFVFLLLIGKLFRFHEHEL
jgi:hypothetical protein